MVKVERLPLLLMGAVLAYPRLITAIPRPTGLVPTPSKGTSPSNLRPPRSPSYPQLKDPIKSSYAAESQLQASPTKTAPTSLEYHVESPSSSAAHQRKVIKIEEESNINYSVNHADPVHPNNQILDSMNAFGRHKQLLEDHFIPIVEHKAILHQNRLKRRPTTQEKHNHHLLQYEILSEIQLAELAGASDVQQLKDLLKSHQDEYNEKVRKKIEEATKRKNLLQEMKHSQTKELTKDLELIAKHHITQDYVPKTYHDAMLREEFGPKEGEEYVDASVVDKEILEQLKRHGDQFARLSTRLNKKHSSISSNKKPRV